MEKWREPLLDPNKIEFKNLVIKSINSYPPAGNDVMECTGLCEDNTINFFLKIQRSEFADFESERDILNILNSNFIVPKVLEYGEKNNLKYIALTKLEGLKLNCPYTKELLIEYGEKLAEIHSLNIKVGKIAKQRKINDYPTQKYYRLDKVEDFDTWPRKIIDYLSINKPEISFDTFIHGDFHYGNILWNNNKISGIIDWEYAGLGFREQDIAWAIILRSTQKFLSTVEEIKYFLNGYSKKASYDEKKLNWCLINGYIHFYLMNIKGDKVYLNKLKHLVNSII